MRSRDGHLGVSLGMTVVGAAVEMMDGPCNAGGKRWRNRTVKIREVGDGQDGGMEGKGCWTTEDARWGSI